MSFDFHKLKTISVANCEVTLCIPERWNFWPEADREGYWGCYEKEVEGKDTDTGTLWVQVDHFSFPGEGELPAEITDMKRTAEEMEAKSLREKNLIESSITPVDQGYRWFRVFDTEEDGEGLRFWFSHFFLNKGHHTAIIAFNFVLPHARMDEPEFLELQGIMSREISSAFLDPFREFDEEKAEDVFGPLSRVSFDDKVKLVLPDSMGCSPQEGTRTSNEWYCRLKAGDSYVAMFITIESLQVSFEENNDEPLLAMNLYEGIIQNWVSKKIGQLAVINMPQGVIAYDVFEGLASEHDDGDGRCFKNYSCRYMHFSEGRGQALTVIIMFPDDLSDVRPFSYLLEYMDRAIRRAEFPPTILPH